MIPSLASGALNLIRARFILKKEIHGDLIMQIFVIMLAVYAISLAILEVLRFIYQKRHDKLENIDDRVI